MHFLYRIPVIALVFLVLGCEGQCTGPLIPQNIN